MGSIGVSFYGFSRFLKLVEVWESGVERWDFEEEKVVILLGRIRRRLVWREKARSLVRVEWCLHRKSFKDLRKLMVPQELNKILTAL